MSFENRPNTSEWDRANTYNKRLFQDTNFYKKYIQYLFEFTSVKYLNHKKKIYKTEIDNRVNLIKTDKAYKDYTFNWDNVFKKAKYTRNKILPRQHLGLQAFRVNGSKSQLELLSYHYFPIEVIGIGDVTQMTKKITEPIIMEGYNHSRPIKKYDLESTEEVEYIYYKTLGVDSLFKTKLTKTSRPDENIPLAEPIWIN